MTSQSWFQSMITASQGKVIAVGGLCRCSGRQRHRAVGVASGTAEQDQQCCRAAATITLYTAMQASGVPPRRTGHWSHGLLK
jgi:uncharacterized protein GlcG (DUF336 family)